MTGRDRYAHVFPDADELARWHALSPEEQRAELAAILKKAMEGPAALGLTKDDIMAEVLAEYAVEA